MIHHAPHLPPKTCNIKTHQRLQVFPVIAAVLVIAIVSGLATTLGVIAWVIPPLFPEQLFSVIGSGAKLGGKAAIDPVIVSQARQRTMSVFDTTKKIGESLYPAQSFVMHTALLSSDGWTVANFPGYRSGSEKHWEGVDAQGVTHKIIRTVQDSADGLLYIKFAGDGFRIFPFAQWDSIDVGATFWAVNTKSLFIHQSSWKNVEMNDPVRRTDDVAFVAWRPEYVYHIIGAVDASALLINDQGELVGFAGPDHTLTPGWLVESQLPGILSAGTVTNPTLAWEGYMIQVGIVENTVKATTGFYVTRPVRRSATAVGRGDIILRVGNHAVDPPTLSRWLLLAPDDFTVTILRDNKEQEIKVIKK